MQSANGRITRLALGEVELEGINQPNGLMNDTATQINEYLAGKRTLFDIPIEMNGSDFQKSVWKAAMDIPYGQTRTPSEIAEIIDAPRSFRSVGKAVSENPIAIIIPAHRITKNAGFASDPRDRSSMLRSRFRELERRYS